MQLLFKVGDGMGGKEALRGFLYQGFAAILKSLTQEFWDKIYVEYPSNDDKVDIAFELNGNITKSIQVKSSINLFQKSNITKWITELTNDIPADEYEVILIGACDKNTKDFINSINDYRSRKKVVKKSEEALKNFDKAILDNHIIRIKQLPLEEDILLESVRDSLNRYISFKGYTLDFEALEYLSKSVIFAKMLLGTNGRALTKREFDSNIFRWIELTSGGLKSKKMLARHNLLFYEQKKQIFSESLERIYMDKYYNCEKYLDDIKKDCINLIKKINAIKLNPCERQKTAQTTSLFGIKSIYPHTFAETMDSEKEEIIKDVKSHFNIDLKREFFFVGNLTEEKKLGLMGSYSYEYKGSKREKEKNNLLTVFKYKVDQYGYILSFIEKIKTYFALPIVIQNVGDIQDENITIKLFIDKSVEVFRGSDYPEDEDIVFYLIMLNDDDNFIESIFKFKSDSKVKVENQNSNYNHIFNQGEIQISDFYNELDMYIAQPQYEEDNYNVIELEVPNIRSGESKFVNKLVLLHSLNENLEIKYTILSDKSDGSNEGVIRIIN